MVFGRLLFGMGQNCARSCFPKIMIWLCQCEYSHCGCVSQIVTSSERQRLCKTARWNSFAKKQTNMRKKCATLLLFLRLQSMNRNRYFYSAHLLKYMSKIGQMNCVLKMLKCIPLHWLQRKTDNLEIVIYIADAKSSEVQNVQGHC